MYPLPPGNWIQAFTSYAGNAGTFTFGFSNLMLPEVASAYNGVIYNDSSVGSRRDHRRHQQHLPLRRAQQGAADAARPRLCRLRRLLELGPLVRHPVRHDVPDEPRQRQQPADPEHVVLLPDGRRQPAPRRRQLRPLRRLGPVPQEHGQLVELRNRQLHQLRRLAARPYDLPQRRRRAARPATT